MTTRQKTKTDDLSRGSGMTPIDNPERDISDDASYEPDSTTGRIPAQDKKTDDREKKDRTAGGIKRGARYTGGR